jgi:two-component system cell cycle response regulator CtrA
MRLLLIEDEVASARAAELMLTSAGFNVEIARTGESGLELALTYSYDAILLDLNLADMSGLEVLRELRIEKSATPVVILSGAQDVNGKVRAFAAGADDYVTKPWHKDELAARLRAVIRRAAGHTHSVITVGDISLDLDARVVNVCGARVHLTSKEYQMMELLALKRGKPICKDAFLTALYGGMDEPGAKIIDVFICKLRQKLAAASNGRRHIETVWGGGYALRDPDSGSFADAA